MTRIPPVRRLLMDAKALIQNPENWVQGEFARSARGLKLDWWHVGACWFCAYGAVLCAGQKLDVGVPIRVSRLLDALAERELIQFNDAPTTTHPMVMRLFNKAIRRAKEQGI